ncbi:beta strand repeat-containing protein [Naasia aerilata]|uniref:PKD domain-containing protein n=1 Tax=Naasia aerilata TaxID=1162966 RepID=A0ABN6XLT2_9MICO|nr:PKD domain-containing protein [Naasia aerilata]BDZ45934.1 hypothetical protein GCM10025866_18430 [Naasia aerilata]
METVSTDVLGTVQVDGVVWSTTIVGNTVYAGGQFTNARPAGAAAGQNQTARANMLAFNLQTGALITGFVANTNGVVNSVTSSPDGSRIYIGGTFTTVNGTTRNRVAALNPTTGAVISGFAPSFNSAVEAVVANNTTVYAAGNFTSVGGTARNRLASVSASTGALNPLSIQVDDRILAMALSPDGSKVVIGGYFTNINGSTDPGFGFGAVNTSTSQVMPWNINKTIRQAGRASAGGAFSQSAAIYSLKSDATGVYGTAYMYPVSGRTLEGSFRADWANGDIVWLDSCKGDSYDVAMNSTTLYLAGHPHDCSTIANGFPDASQQNPRVYHRAMAWSKNASSNKVLSGEFANWPTPTMLSWWPDFNTGTFTGQSQGPWAIAATDNYVVYAGEFTRVNNIAQQGIVRFASKAIAPNDDGPRVTGSSFVPTVVGVSSGVVDVKWQTNYDRDNQYLTYDLIRGAATATPIYTAVQGSRANFDRPTMTYRDSGLTPGSSQQYRIRATDPFGNSVTGNAVTVTIPSSSPSGYSPAVVGDAPTAYWRLGETSGTRFADQIGVNALNGGTGVSGNQAGALSGDADRAASFPGTQAGVATSVNTVQAPAAYTEEAWFKTSSTTGGNILSFGSGPAIDVTVDNATTSDRVVSIDSSGKIAYSANSARGSVSLNTTKSGYNDNQWHHVAVTVGATGARLYVDGVLAGQNTSVTALRSAWGYWRVGGDVARVAGGPTYFSGTVDEVAVYAAQLAPEQISEHYTLSGRTVGAAGNLAPNATFTSVTNQLNVAFNASASTDPDGSVAGYSWQFGDGTTGTGATPSHAYSVAGNYVVTLTVTDNQGATNDFVATVRPNTNNPPTAAFTSTTDGLTVNVNGGTSTDTDGTISSYLWNWGDNSPTTTTTTPTASHAYASAASYTITLTVRDNAFATGVTTGVVTVAGNNTNATPTASYTSVVNGLTVAFTSTSTDPDGTIAAYAWTFGDGTTSTLANPNKAYANAGTYPITLKVTDDKGASGTTSGSITVGGATPPNTPPTAAFTNTVNGLGVSVNGSTSTDTDGTVASYSWNWGDNTTPGTGVTATHTYATAGTYTITLTVTDDDAATDTQTASVTVSAAPGGTAYANDTFTRTTTGGLGTANTGGAWMVSSTASNYAVSNGAARFTNPAGSTRTGYLSSVSVTDSDVAATATVTTRPTSGSAYVGLLARRVGSSFYLGRAVVAASGSVSLQLLQTSTTLRTVNVTGLSVASGDQLRIRVQAVGTSPTTLNAKVWKVGTPEPTAWQATITDATAALQANGSVGLYSYLSASAAPTSVTYAFDDFSAGPSGGTTPPPANAAPTAAFTSTVTGLGVSVNSAGSADSDGTITGYSWNWGDNTAAGSGATATHTYAAAGTYNVVLTVTDNGGATGTVTHAVTVTAPPAGNAAPVASFTNSVSGLTVNVTSTSTDSDGTVTGTAWNWGDGTPAGSGATASHTYVAAGTYTVTLSVTDNGGATDTETASVTVATTPPPAGNALASDDFARTTSGGWGSATVGGAWTRGSSTTTAYSTDGSVGLLTTTTPGKTLESFLNGVTSTNADVQATASLSAVPSGGTVYVSVIGRRVGTSDYRARAAIAAGGAITAQLQVNGSTVQSAATGLTYAAGDQLRIRLQVTGTSPTTLRVKIWKVGTPEPTTWRVTATDTTVAALQAAGSPGLGAYIGNVPVPSTVSFDDFVVTEP